MKNKKRDVFYTISLVLLAAGFAFVHIHHVSTLFENDRHFSHLSNLEREMTFRTEMGFYYHFYKKLINAPTYEAGLRSLMHDNQTEYPDTINALQRFNLFPEILIGGLYRVFDSVTKYYNIPTKQCWEVHRGPSIPTVNSCVGLGDPMYFYLEFVWYCAGLSKAVLFIYAVVLSDSFSGGLLTVLSFLYNHGHCTRVQWSPPLRESFGYPFLLLQMLAITYCLKNSSTNHNSPKLKISFQVWAITLSTTISLVLWQFSQFVIATQTLAVFILFCLDIIDKRTALIIQISQLIGLLKATILLFGNAFLFQSILFSLLIATILMVIRYPSRTSFPTLKGISVLFAVTYLTLFFKTKISQFYGDHDAHIFDLLWSKLTNYKNFHTMLYSCSAEFDFLPMSTLYELTITGLIPTVAIVLSLLLFKWIKILFKENSIESLKLIEPEIGYNILQLGAFTIMALFIMRLKLFWTPHLCIMVSLIMSYKCLPSKTNFRYALLTALIGIMSYHGLNNLIQQRNIMGEYENLPFEEVLNWINSETLPTDVFAGPMCIMANVLLSTGRRIVNHPHYEHKSVRDRTMQVYSLFSRQSASEVYSTLYEMGVDYVILDESRCFFQSRENCSMVDLWDVVDFAHKNNEPLCPKLFSGNPRPFIKIFSNEVFVILSLKAMQLVEIVPPLEYQI